MRTRLSRWIVVIGLGIATVAVYHPRYKTHNIDVEGFESSALAQSLAAHRGFSDPFEALPTGPSAHLAPLYPAYLALLIVVFGNGTMAGNFLVWSNLLLLAVQLMMLPFLARWLGLGFWVGVLASVAWIAAGIPPVVMGESVMVAVLAICVTLLMFRSFQGELSCKEWVVSGLLWGTLLLLQPVVILILPVWMLLLRFRSSSSLRQILALGLLPLVVVMPWTVRNFLVFHQPVFIRDDLGLELAVSNNDCASAFFEVNDENGCFESTHPNKNYEEAFRVREMGEVAYNHMRFHEALDWIKQNPKRFASLCEQRFVAFWFPPPSLNKNNGMIWRPKVLDLFTLLSLPGMFLMWRNARKSAYALALWLALFPPIYYFVQFMDRYRYPIFWVSFLAGSYFITELVRGLIGGRKNDDSEIGTDRLTIKRAS
jgi:hypothetical protein